VLLVCDKGRTFHQQRMQFTSIDSKFKRISPFPFIQNFMITSSLPSPSPVDSIRKNLITKISPLFFFFILNDNNLITEIFTLMSSALIVKSDNGNNEKSFIVSTFCMVDLDLHQRCNVNEMKVFTTV
jgi:hypothetical protein